ncbi:hypothetical protein O6A27_29120, partial [Escherichia coli]|nr:hypothetical protein [Escherichia coli]
PEPLFDGHFRLLQQRLVGERHLKVISAVSPSPPLVCMQTLAKANLPPLLSVPVGEKAKFSGRRRRRQHHKVNHACGSRQTYQYK